MDFYFSYWICIFPIGTLIFQWEKVYFNVKIYNSNVEIKFFIYKLNFPTYKLISPMKKLMFSEIDFKFKLFGCYLFTASL